MQGDPRIVFIDGFWVDVPVEGRLLLTTHQDKPGLGGRVGTLLGAHNVNISLMQDAAARRAGSCSTPDSCGRETR